MTRARRFLFIPLGLSLASAALADDAGLLARVGGIEISVEEVRAALQGLGAIDEAALARDPAMLNQMVRSLVVQRLILRQAREQKFDQQPEIAARLERARESALADAYLQSISEPPADYPSEAELKSVFEANQESFRQPRAFRLAQIFIASDKNDSQEAKAKTQAKVDALAEKLKKPSADFALIARAESEEAQSAANGGEIGWLTEEQIQPELRPRLPQMKLGAVSEPIRLNDGWHILKTLDVRESFTPTFDQARPALRKRLRSDRAKENTKAHIAKLLAENPLAINELALAKVLPSAAAK